MWLVIRPYFDKQFFRVCDPKPFVSSLPKGTGQQVCVSGHYHFVCSQLHGLSDILEPKKDDSVIAAALIQAGANINHVGKDAMTALDLAAGCGSVKCVEILCDLSKNLPALEELEYYISVATDEEQKLRIQQCRSIIYQRMEALADKYAAILIKESETEKETKKKKII